MLKNQNVCTSIGPTFLSDLNPLSGSIFHILNMKTTLIVNEEKFHLDFELNHYEADDYMPSWKSWTNLEEVMAQPQRFFKSITVQSFENLEFESLDNSLKEKIFQKLFEEAMEFKKKEGDFLTYHHTGDIPSSSYRDLNFSWVDYSKKPILVKTFTDKLGEEIEIRQSGERNKYVKKDAAGEMLRLDNGDLVYLSEEEISNKGLALFDTSVYAFNKKGECVGYTSDEWGADGVWVLPDYQKRGIGLELLSLHRSQFKESRKIGQMTHAGVRLTLALFRKNNQ